MFRVCFLSKMMDERGRLNNMPADVYSLLNEYFSVSLFNPETSFSNKVEAAKNRGGSDNHNFRGTLQHTAPVNTCDGSRVATFLFSSSSSRKGVRTFYQSC